MLPKVAVQIIGLTTGGGCNTSHGWSGGREQQVSDYDKQPCSNMKAKGIGVFAVGFTLDGSTAGGQTIAFRLRRSFGSGVSHFY